MFLFTHKHNLGPETHTKSLPFNYSYIIVFILGVLLVDLKVSNISIIRWVAMKILYRFMIPIRCILKTLVIFLPFIQHHHQVNRQTCCPWQCGPSLYHQWLYAYKEDLPHSLRTTNGCCLLGNLALVDKQLLCTKKKYGYIAWNLPVCVCPSILMLYLYVSVWSITGREGYMLQCNLHFHR